MRVTTEHINAILFGVAIGDALGVPVEFQSREYLQVNPVRDMIGYGTYNQPPGTWSDDSTMTFCLAETLLDDEFSLRSLANRFINWVDWGYWTPHGELFDIGNTTAAAIDRLRSIDDPTLAGGRDETENGNGALMRILPLVLELVTGNHEDTWQLVHDVSALTHGHVRSIICCYYYLLLARQLMRGQTKETAIQITNSEMKDFLKAQSIPDSEVIHFDRILNGDISDLNYSDLRGSGYVMHSLESAIYCLLHSETYEEAVLKAIHLGEDTDTTAAITGGLAALAFGPHTIPERWMEALVKKEKIQDLAQRLSQKYTIKIKLSDVPVLGDTFAANTFAHKFSGYRITFDETARHVRQTQQHMNNGTTDKVSVDEVIESLFFYFRAVRHGGGKPDDDFVKKHIELIRSKLDA